MSELDPVSAISLCISLKCCLNIWLLIVELYSESVGLRSVKEYKNPIFCCVSLFKPSD